MSWAKVALAAVVVLHGSVLYSNPYEEVIADAGGIVGVHSSIAVVNGFPAISYIDQGNYDLRYVRATLPDGSTWGSPVVVDASSIAHETSLAVVNGNPAISYQVFSQGVLRFVRATDANGSAWGAYTTVVASGNVGRYSSLAVVNGNPAISYYDETNGDLMFVRATDSSGTAWGQPISVDTYYDVGKFTSLHVVNGTPAISYSDPGNPYNYVRYVRALDSEGTTWDTPTSLGQLSGAAEISNTALTVVNGNPAVCWSWFNSAAGATALVYRRANDIDGDSWGNQEVVDSRSGSGERILYASMAVINGKPAISYYDYLDSALFYARSLDDNGTTWSTYGLDTYGLVGEYTSLVEVNGKPGMSYHDYTNHDLKYAWNPSPTVEFVNSTDDTGDGVLSEGEATNAFITQLHVDYSDGCWDPAGDFEPDDVTNPANYLLFSAGNDGSFQTQDCLGGIAPTDSAISVDSVIIDSGTWAWTLSVNGGAALPDGLTRLQICGTTSVLDTEGNPLDGNGDGVGGDDFLRTFRVDRTLPMNPALASTTHNVGVWSGLSTVGFSWSGASDGGGSGVAGYSVVMDMSAGTDPDGAIEVVQGSDPHTRSEGPLSDGDSHYFHLRTCDMAGNCASAEHRGPYWIDTTPPGPPTEVTSPSHPIGVLTIDPTIDVDWTAATDNLSGVVGYGYEFTTSASWTCDEVQDTTGTSTTSGALPVGNWYFHICAVDRAGHWGPVATGGAYLIGLALFDDGFESADTSAWSATAP